MEIKNAVFMTSVVSKDKFIESKFIVKIPR